MISHLINTAKSLIPKYWLNSECPTVGVWISKIGSIYNMEELYHIGENKIERCMYIWKGWIEFKNTRRYTELKSRHQED